MELKGDGIAVKITRSSARPDKFLVRISIMLGDSERWYWTTDYVDLNDNVKVSGITIRAPFEVTG